MSVQKEKPPLLALTQGLIVSAALNLFLLLLFLFLMVKESPPLTFPSFRESTSFQVRGQLQPASLTFLEEISTRRFDELSSSLLSEEPLEEGITKRDLALSWMVAAHHFDLSRALFALSKPIAQRRVKVKLQGKSFDLYLFPKLPEKHLEAILKFAQKEKWPFDAEGLYQRIKEGVKEPTLFEAFAWTKEYLHVERLLKERGIDLKAEEVIPKLLESGWGFEEWRFPEPTKLYPLFEPKLSKEVWSAPLTVAPKAEPKASRAYTIQEGDSLWKIAKRHGVSVEALKKKNPHLAPILRPGTKIEIP